MIVLKGSTDVTTYFHLRLSATGLDATGLTPSDVDMQYTRNRVAPTAKVDCVALAATDAAHTDNRGIEIDATDQPGLYRFDWPDAAFATGVSQVLLTIKVATAFTETLRVDLVDYNSQDGVRLGLTALPNAAADGVGGLPISDAGGLDLDSKLANTNEVTAARMGALTDWINGGRLDLILDIIAADTTTDIPALIAALNNLSLANAQTAANDALIANNLDHLLLSAVPTNFQGAVHDDSVIGHMAAISDANAFARANDSLQAQRENFDAVVAAEPTVADIQAGLFKAVRSNTATAGAATTITLDASASAVNDFYINNIIAITGGTGAGQSRFITDYVGSTKVATVSTWATNPDNTSTFSIFPFDAIVGATAPTAAAIADEVQTRTIAGVTLVTTLTTYTGNTPQTGDSFARIGAAGASLTAADDAMITALGVISTTIGAAGAGLTAAGLTAANVRTAVGLASANLDTQLDAIPTAAELATSQAAADDAMLAAIAALNNLTAGAAMTLTSGERNSIATALLDLADGIEAGWTLRQSQRLQNSAAAGNTAGMDTATGTLRDLADTKDRITATLSATGRTVTARDVT